MHGMWRVFSLGLWYLLNCSVHGSNVQINRIINTNLATGDLVEIEGQGFYKIFGAKFFGGVALRVYPEVWEDDKLSFRVPTLAKSGPITFYYSEGNINYNIISASINVQTPLEKFKTTLGLPNNDSIVPWSGKSIVETFFRAATNPTTSINKQLIRIEEEKNLFEQGSKKKLRLTIEKNANAPELESWIEKSYDLSAATWSSTPLESFAAGSSSGVATIVYTDTLEAVQERVFYRLAFKKSDLTNPVWPSQLNLSQRIAAVGFPKTFRAWNEGTDPMKPGIFSGKHDLAWESVANMDWNNDEYKGMGTDLISTEWDYLIQWKREILQKNPNMILLVELAFFEFWGEELPENSPYWLLDANSKRIAHWSDSGAAAATSTYCLDFSRPDFQDHVATRASNLVAKGVFDGVLLDWWSEPEPSSGYGLWRNTARPSTYSGSNTNVALLERDAKIKLLQKIRTAVGTNKVIIGNMNYGKYADAPIGSKLLSATNLDGVYMELFYETEYPTSGIAPFLSVTEDPYFSKPGAGDPNKTRWRKAEEFISYAEKTTNLFRSQPLNCIEFQHRWGGNDPRDLRIMRASLALVLTCSDSYYLYAEPNFWRTQIGLDGSAVDRPDHMHEWRSSWDKNLGKPVDSKRDPLDSSQKNSNGMYSRAFDQGIVFYNPPDNPQKTLVFAKPVKSVSTGNTATSHAIGAGPDGDIFLLTQPGDPR